MSSPGLVSTKEVDYLDEDKPLRGQNYVCMSFLSPEDVIQNKECFVFTKYIEKFSKDLLETIHNLQTKYPEDKGLLDTILENHDFLFDPKKMQDNYEFFKSVHGGDAEKEFNEQNDFRTSVRGIKVRGVFDTMKEAQMRADLLKRMGDKFNIYVGQVGCWCPWSPNPDDLQDSEYAESQLNTLMKKYKENLLLRDQHYEDRKNAKIEEAKKAREEAESATVVTELQNTEDPWLQRKEVVEGAEDASQPDN